jgi:hypothetical protein
MGGVQGSNGRQINNLKKLSYMSRYKVWDFRLNGSNNDLSSSICTLSVHPNIVRNYKDWMNLMVVPPHKRIPNLGQTYNGKKIGPNPCPRPL